MNSIVFKISSFKREQFFKLKEILQNESNFTKSKKKIKNYGLHASSAAPITTLTSSDRFISDIFLSDSSLAV